MSPKLFFIHTEFLITEHLYFQNDILEFKLLGVKKFAIFKFPLILTSCGLYYFFTMLAFVFPKYVSK